MEEIQYIGERLWAGQLGHFLIVLSFVASIFAFVSFFLSQKRSGTPESHSWLKMGRIGFIVQGLGILATIGLMFYMMLNQFYEYQYVNSHVSADLPTRYIFSAFWEGQEGSFLLWMFWHVILGFVIIWKRDKWEASVLATLSMIQFFLLSMLVGFVFEFGATSFKLGSSPFLLLRDVFDLPLFNKENYVELIGGQGMNILLQNYWMTIHPPTLFLGFASTAIPFGYAIGGLWTREHKATMKAVLPWALFSGGILGTGILMGAAWAYEALSFGGYWAWDPVENASLVPWLILVAAIHGNLVARSTGYSVKSTYLFYILTFLFIVYSTFLTRSGILGDSSAHAFTEMGLEWQLVIFMLVTILYSLISYFKNSHSIIVPKKEEATFSKEFWMFIGSIVLIFSAVLITFTTSIPVYNAIGGWFGIDAKMSAPNEVIEHYNKYQIWIGILVGILSGFAQYLRWKEFDFSKRFTSIRMQLLIGLGLSVVLTGIFASMLYNKSIPNILLLFAGFYTVISNLDYVLLIIRGKMKLAGSALSHIGLGIFILGVISSGVNKHYLSSNPYAQRGLFDEFDYEKNVTLIKGLPTFMNGYRVTFVRDTFDEFDRYYHLNFQELEDSTGVVLDEFDSYPSIVYNKEFKLASTNPATKRYAHKDIFNHLAGAPEAEVDPDRAKEIESELAYVEHDMNFHSPITLVDTVKAGDKSYPRYHQAYLRGITRDGSHPDYHPQEGDIVFAAELDIIKHLVDTVLREIPMIVLRENLLYNFPAQINTMGWKAKLSESFINQYFKTESELVYKDITMKDGQSIRYGDHTVTLAGFDRSPTHSSYSALPDDIALSAKLIVKSDAGPIAELNPIYLVRNAQVFQIKDEDFKAGLSAKFGAIDPKNETFTISLGQYDLANLTFPVTIAQDAPRNDWIVLESIVFPGMNMVWIGAIAMMIGLFFSIWNRISTKRSTLQEA